MSPVERAILSTLAYRDVFDYPLDESELWRGLIGSRSFSRQEFKKGLKRLLARALIGFQGQYYYLSNRSDLVLKRRVREREAKKKFRLAKKWRMVFRFLPGVWGVWVTGSVAQNNAKSGDDVDLLIVTAPDQLWWARFWVWLALSLGRRRRRPGQTQTVDLFCANLFLAIDRLTMETNRQNLFTAVELVGARPIWHRSFLDEQLLLTGNHWISDFLPHVDIKSDPIWPAFSPPVTGLLNKVFYWGEHWYLSSKKTREEVSLGRAFFHPRDTASLVKEKFFLRLKQLQIKPEQDWFE